MGFIIIIITFLFVLCGSVSVYIVDVHMWRSGDKELVLAFHHVSLRDQTQAVRLGSRHLPVLHLWYFPGDSSRAVPQIQLGPDLCCNCHLSKTQRQKGEAKLNSLCNPKHHMRRSGVVRGAPSSFSCGHMQGREGEQADVRRGGWACESRRKHAG